MDWQRDGAGWPNATHSSFVRARPHLWHVQIMGAGPDLLLLHGTGGATHSWRDLMPMLATRFRCIAPDLPGQGFTRRGAMQRASLPLMAEDMWRLMDKLDARPALILGHSAGGALGLQMSLTRPTPVMGLNAALEDFDGVAGWLFPMMARALATNPITAPAVAAMVRSADVGSLIRSTGSTLDAEGTALYARCLSNAEHVAGTLAMMSQWSLRGLRDRFDRLSAPVHLLAGAGDKTVPPDSAARMAARIPGATTALLLDLGHLAHEEDPQHLAALIMEFAETLAPHQA